MKNVIIVILLLFAAQIFSYFYTVDQRKNKSEAAKFNAYKSFDEALQCHCDTEAVKTPPLKVMDLIQIKKSDLSLQKWVLVTEAGLKISFENNTLVCPSFHFNRNDEIQIQGSIYYTDSGPVIRKNRSGYIEYHGRKYCENQ